MTSDPLGIEGKLLLEKYSIEKLVGEGGFAVVYRATHVVWNAPVAIKFFTSLSSVSQEQQKRLEEEFIREGALLAELSSHTAAIVQARDVGTYVTDRGTSVPYIVLEWLEGASLEQLLEREQAAGMPPWTMQDTFALIRKVGEALDVAHRAGIAHRDVKPGNIFIRDASPSRTSESIKLLDFGVAKILSDRATVDAASAKTGMHLSSFTPMYGAPEQFVKSYGATGPWTDVYALALVAAELLSGKPAIDGDDFTQLGVATVDPNRRPTPKTLDVPLPDAAEAVFERAVAVDPRQRYARAGEFVDALAEALGLATSGRTTSSAVPLAAGQTALAAGETALAPAGTPMALARSSQKTTAAPSSTSVNAPPRSRGLRLGGAALGVLGVGIAVFLGFRSSGGGSGTEDSEAVSLSAAATPAASSAAPVTPLPALCPSKMAKIGPGQYFRGSDANEAPDNQKPAHAVELRAYCIDLYEVTASEYKACSDVGKCKRASTEVDWPDISDAARKNYSPLCTFGQEGKDDYPINCVTWDMARIYCEAQGKRLPTEAEWEYAARGPDGRIYPWGDEPPTAEHLNACGPECVAWGTKHGERLAALYEKSDGYETLAPVGKFPKGSSRFGPHDIVGNVWEWVADYYGAYSDAPLDNPTGPESGEKRVIRGGGWNGGYESWLHPAFRYSQAPEAKSHGIGFRCAQDQAGSETAPEKENAER